MNTKKEMTYKSIEQAIDNDAKTSEMLCPVCKSKLVANGVARMETLAQHVCDPNAQSPETAKFECSDPFCITVGVCFWNDEGEGPYVNNYPVFKTIKFLDKNYAPFNTFWRGNIAESNAKKSKVICRIGKIKANLNTTYECNDSGEKIKTHREIDFYYKDRFGWTLMRGLPMMKYYRKEFFSRHGEDRLKFIEKCVENNTNGEWWRVLSIWWMKKLKFTCK